MEIKAKRQANGEYMIEIGPVIFNLPQPVVEALHQVINDRGNKQTPADKARTEKRLAAYRSLANKLAVIEDPLMQSLLTQIRPEQMVTLARMASDDSVYQKIVRNLSRQNARQFEEDFARISKISVHQASSQMELMLPILKKAIQARKQIQAQG
ncbi:MAG: FliG C-terminal domain-containing protein [Thiomicrospira sp.]|jgi:flagellar motor switch protein FliG|nr:FliG C-terminal domain-containing protein [Thiomicrospira sp.]